MAKADIELAAMAKAGDSAALDVLMHRYKNLVRSRAAMFFLTGGDRDDLIQEGMIGLYKAVCDYDAAKGSFNAFAALCVNRQIMSAVKASARQKHQMLNDSLNLETSDGDALDLDSLPTAHDSDPASLLVGRETYRDIGSSLKERLSPLEYEVLTLHISGASRDEIAEATGKSKKSVDNTLTRARRKMGKVIYQ
jgi:RNA polymerase sporulation-specific sigma factor